MMQDFPVKGKVKSVLDLFPGMEDIFRNESAPHPFSPGILFRNANGRWRYVNPCDVKAILG
jgi:hypothetical protein